VASDLGQQQETLATKFQDEKPLVQAVVCRSLLGKKHDSGLSSNERLMSLGMRSWIPSSSAVLVGDTSGCSLPCYWHTGIQLVEAGLEPNPAEHLFAFRDGHARISKTSGGSNPQQHSLEGHR